MTRYELCSAILLWLALAGPSWAGNYVGRIVGVVDGDTVDLLLDAKEVLRCRLSGIDAPEKKQAFGNVSKKALSDLVYNRRAELVGNKRDRYGRLVCKVIVDGVDANLQMVRLGMAWHFKKYEREQTPDDRRLYSEAERSAREAHRGLWRDKDPVAPWDFRALRKAGAVASR